MKIYSDTDKYVNPFHVDIDEKNPNMRHFFLRLRKCT